MKKLLSLNVLFLLTIFSVRAQTKAQAKIDSVNLKTSKNEQSEKFKKNDTAYRKLEADKSMAQLKTDSADLKLTSCDFEKEANAMVLSDHAIMAYGAQIIMERFKRIKIFNDNGKSEANIRIEYSNRFGEERVLAVVAETINFTNGKIERTKLDSALIYNVHTDKEKDAIIFTMPNVKAGSVIQYAYVWGRNSSANFPDWNFQCNLPTRYSEISIFLTPQLLFTQLTKTNQPFVKDSVDFRGQGHTWAMQNIPSIKNEPYARSATDGTQHLSVIIKGFKNLYGNPQGEINSWEVIGKQISDNKFFAKPYGQSLNDDEDIVKSAKKLKTQDEKIAFVFNRVKTLMKWNQQKEWRSKDGIKSAWKNKTGNWGEINMSLCYLLKKLDIKAYPMLVSTRDNGLMYSNFPNFYQINKLVIYIPVDTAKYYVLDAAGKYNLYDEIPYELLNSNGLYLDKEHEKYGLVELNKVLPVKRSIIIQGDIQDDGSVSGTTIIYDHSYNKSGNSELHNTLDEKKYETYLTDNDNNIKITALKFENADIDSLPLVQTIQFKLDLATNDEKYIYFNPNLFTSLRDNPFINQTRTNDIDFGYKNNLTFRGRFKLPANYKVDFLPKNISLVNADKTISFRRLIQEEDGCLTFFYSIDYKSSYYSKDGYAGLYNYFKKMYELLNEQVVLKK